MFSRSDRVVKAGGLVTFLVLALLSQQAHGNVAGSTAPEGALRILIITGQGDHDWRSTVPFLRCILDHTGRFDVRICETPAGLTARTLDAFDAVVDDCGASASGDDLGKTIAQFVESGKGLVITRGALGRSARAVPDYWPASPSDGSRSTAQFLEIKIARSEHPITRGVPDRFKIADATNRGMAARPGALVIADVLPEADGAKNRKAVLIASHHGNGRIFCTGLGHDLAAMQETAFITTFARGTEWAASGKVTLPPLLGTPRPNRDAVRGLVITGGHDHETGFYTLFERYPDLAWLPVASGTTAFQTDLRQKYDVLIMYDFTRELDEKGKKNLRDFVESGKGIVVLHHALLNYQDWPWWFEEVVGGRYRLKPEGGTPSSTVKDGQDIFVNVAAEHPITAGIGPFHIVDETYKRMGFSPKIKPLLTTDNPYSDRVLAWIGPSTASRVVAIQLGHGHTAHHHPKYRALVHRAILWSADRMK
jgi:type 1 glutamine amidotransferase